MTGVFSQILNMSLMASAVILLLLLVRLPLKHAPKAVSYALWGIVLFRLLCPVSLPSAASLFAWTDVPAVEAGQTMSAISYLPTIYPSNVPAAAENTTGSVETAAPQAEKSQPDVRTIAAWVWLAGAAAMVVWAAAAYLRLLLWLRTAMPLRKRVYLAGHISTPFVLGILRPRIYLPSDLREGERDYILLHERLHIHRCDHLLRPLAYGALCLHWFNPLVWIAYVLSGRDMEMACDEAVVKKLGAEIRASFMWWKKKDFPPSTGAAARWRLWTINPSWTPPAAVLLPPLPGFGGAGSPSPILPKNGQRSASLISAPWRTFLSSTRRFSISPFLRFCSSCGWTAISGWWSSRTTDSGRSSGASTVWCPRKPWVWRSGSMSRRSLTAAPIFPLRFL